MSRCETCNRWTFDYRPWLPWWLVPRRLAGRQNFGGECMTCVEKDARSDPYYTCDHDWRPVPFNGAPDSFVPRHGAKQCVKCKATMVSVAPAVSQPGSGGVPL